MIHKNHFTYKNEFLFIRCLFVFEEKYILKKLILIVFYLSQK